MFISFISGKGMVTITGDTSECVVWIYEYIVQMNQFLWTHAVASLDFAVYKKVNLARLT